MIHMENRFLLCMRYIQTIQVLSERQRDLALSCTGLAGTAWLVAHVAYCQRTFRPQLPFTAAANLFR